MTNGEYIGYGIIALVALIAVLLVVLAVGLMVYSTGYMLMKGERLKARIVDMELSKASHGCSCCAVVEFERNGQLLRMTTQPIAMYGILFAERLMQRALRRWKGRELTVLYGKPYKKRDAQVCILRWIWKEIFWEMAIIAILLLAAIAIIDRI